MMNLRVMNKQDIAVIKKWPAYPEEFKDLDYALRGDGWLQEFFGKEWTKVYAAEENGIIIGFTILILPKDPGASSQAEFRIALNPGMLGQGIGRNLARLTLEKGFQELGLHKIYLIVRKSNHRAKELYKHLGFRDSGECKKEIQGIMVDLFEMALEKEVFENGRSDG